MKFSAASGWGILKIIINPNLMHADMSARSEALQIINIWEVR